MNAPITPTHRALAFGATWTCQPSENERAWIVTGEGVGGGPLLRGVAQALANLEAKTAHRAWDEGYEQGCQDEPRSEGSLGRTTPNPYPELMP